MSISQRVHLDDPGPDRLLGQRADHPVSNEMLQSSHQHLAVGRDEHGGSEAGARLFGRPEVDGAEEDAPKRKGSLGATR